MGKPPGFLQSQLAVVPERARGTSQEVKLRWEERELGLVKYMMMADAQSRWVVRRGDELVQIPVQGLG